MAGYQPTPLALGDAPRSSVESVNQTMRDHQKTVAKLKAEIGSRKNEIILGVQKAVSSASFALAQLIDPCYLFSQYPLPPP